VPSLDLLRDGGTLIEVGAFVDLGTVPVNPAAVQVTCALAELTLIRLMTVHNAGGGEGGSGVVVGVGTSVGTSVGTRVGATVGVGVGVPDPEPPQENPIVVA